MTTLETLTDTATGIGRDAKAFASSAGKRLDAARDETAGALHAAAESVLETGRQGSGKIDGLAARTAGRLNATAVYVEDHDLNAVFRSLRRFGRRHPVSVLVGVAAICFVAGSAATRVTHCSRG